LLGGGKHGSHREKTDNGKQVAHGVYKVSDDSRRCLRLTYSAHDHVH
jgi:hypothetical protein